MSHRPAEIEHSWPFPEYDFGAPSPAAFEFTSPDRPARVATSSFDPCELDSMEDQAREVLAKGGRLSTLIRELLTDEMAQLRAEGARAVLGVVLDSKNVQLSVHCLAFAVGYRRDLSMPGIADLMGCSKQNVQFHVTQIREKLGLRTPGARTAEQRARMSRAYHSRPKAPQNAPKARRRPL
jgi:hypothetical protein